MYYAERLHLLLFPESAVSQKPALVQQQRHLPRVESSATASLYCIVLRYQTLSVVGKHNPSSASSHFTEAVAVPMALVQSWSRVEELWGPRLLFYGFSHSKWRAIIFRKLPSHKSVFGLQTGIRKHKVINNSLRVQWPFQTQVTYFHKYACTPASSVRCLLLPISG